MTSDWKVGAIVATPFLAILVLLLPVRLPLDRPLTAVEEKDLRPIDAFQECAACPRMVVIPSGKFLMGFSSGSEFDVFAGLQATNTPRHEVTIARPFAVGRYAVTFDEWDACVAAGACDRFALDEGWGRGRRPVINVSWEAAKAYVAWLSKITGKSYRLLSEAEREYVTRAASTTPFWWGASIMREKASYGKVEASGKHSRILNDIYDLAIRGDGLEKTTRVNSFAPNAWGLLQVHGNVWEWVEDCWNDTYWDAPLDGSAWTTGNCEQRVLRGGSWKDPPWLLRADARHAAPSNYRANNVGLRVARTIR